MRLGLWMVALIAIIGLFAVMAMYLQTLSRTSAGKMARVSAKVKEQYSLEDALVRVVIQPTGRIMAVEYTTARYSAFDREKQDGEMRAIGTSALEQLAEGDRKHILSVSVARSEIQGSGCFRQEYKSSLEMENPFRTGTAPK